MARPHTYDGLPYERLREAAFDSDPATTRTPRVWLDRATTHAESARQAERRGSKADMFVANSRVVMSYTNAMSHPEAKNLKIADRGWAQRLADFKPTYEASVKKARALKAELKAADEANGNGTMSPPPVPPPAQRTSPALQTDPGGSIADRMKALRGHGMDVRHAPMRSQDFDTGGAPGLTSPTPGGASEHSAHPSLTLPSPSTNATNGVHSLDTTGGSSAYSHSHSPHSPYSPHSTYSPTAHPANSAAIPIRSPASTRGGGAALGMSPTDELNKFEHAFPSLDNFSKQFGDLDVSGPSAASAGSPTHTTSPSGPPPSSLDILSLPSLPSVPMDTPGKASASKAPSGAPPSLPAPPPPPRIDPNSLGLDVAAARSPPSPDLLSDIKRPASTPMFGDGGAGLSSSPPLDSHRSPTSPTGGEPVLAPAAPVSAAAAAAPGTSPTDAAPRHVASPEAARSPTLPDAPLMSFPKATPAPPPPFGMPAKRSMPDFPFSNTITPEILRSYFLNLSVDILLLDVRPQNDKEGYVGQEYFERGCRINSVWLDPTVIMRHGINSSSDLEDAMSIMDQDFRLAFENRHKYDLVVVYDKRSTTLPKKGEPATPESRLISLIHENEYVKPLPRFPVILIGGYDGWRDFIKRRIAQNNTHYSAANMSQQPSSSSGGGGGAVGAAASGGGGSSRPYNPRTNGNGPGPQPLGPKPVGAGNIPEYVARKAPLPPPPGHGHGHGHGHTSQQSTSQYSKEITENFNYGQPQSMTGSLSYSGHHVSAPSYPTSPPPQHARPPVPRTSHAQSNSISTYSTAPGIAPPPRASIHPGAGTRRQSGYLDNSQQYSGFGASSRPSIDYPQAHALALVPQPPPAAATHSLERHDQRAAGQVVRSTAARPIDHFTSSSGVRYWRNSKLGLTGLKNLGNTCYMNSTIQCLSATLPFARFFLDGRYRRDINLYNNLGTKGDLAAAFAELLGALWGENYTFLSPISFRKSIIKFKSDFAGTEQHDSQEFLSFVLDGLHEDLNRIKVRPKPVEMTPEREAALESLPPQIASDKEWSIYKQRNDSFIVDLFQGQYMNRMECLTCHKTSTVYDSFQWLTLDLPSTKQKVVLPQLFDRWVSPEILDGDEKWFCPRCKTHRRASKTLTLVRLPPVLLIQLKRFLPVNGGRFWNKSETPVIFPLDKLDLTRFVPPRQPTGAEDMDDPRTQVGPFVYELYGVSNHMGTLSSGHYTAYVRSSDQWMYCEDSRVVPARQADVVSRPGAEYILFYKRVDPASLAPGS